MISIEALYAIFLQYPNIATDTRKITKEAIFFALKGDNFNGNSFAAKALELGASYVVIDEEQYYINEKTILVDDVLSNLQALAKYHRQQFTIPFIAITGSNGKTTSKELVNAVLASGYKTYTTQGNLNNHIGVPLTLLSVKKDAEVAIIEMGANHQKEIAGYCEYTLPTHGIITNCGKAHLEGFGGVEGVKKGKGELFDFIRATDGTIFLMQDYDYLQQMSTGIKNKFSYGTQDADLVGTIRSSEPFLSVTIQDTIIHSHLVGAYNLPNILLATAVGVYFKIPIQQIKASIENYMPSNSRSQLIEKDTNKIILDAYNANPSSMQLAIENLQKLDVPNKVLILGAMAELGEESIAEHEYIVALISKYTWLQVILVGGDFLKIKHSFLSFSNANEAGDWLKTAALKNCYILVKGSRSSTMERVLV
jgi:UDP-N-acetylmuramoyl-tripeptide--D-alanyl-D-alanine ligase